MVICIFGITCVGKSTIGKLMTESINIKNKYTFYDVDSIIKERYGTILKFQKQYPDDIKRSIKKQEIMIEAFKLKNVIIAVSPLHDISLLLPYKNKRGFCFINIEKPLEIVFNRLIYTDDNDVYDEEYTKQMKNKYKDNIMLSLQGDDEYFKSIYNPIIKNSYYFPFDDDKEIAEILIQDLKLSNDN